MTVHSYSCRTRIASPRPSGKGCAVSSSANAALCPAGNTPDTRNHPELRLWQQRFVCCGSSRNRVETFSFEPISVAFQPRRCPLSSGHLWPLRAIRFRRRCQRSMLQAARLPSRRSLHWPCLGTIDYVQERCATPAAQGAGRHRKREIANRTPNFRGIRQIRAIVNSGLKCHLISTYWKISVRRRGHTPARASEDA